MNKYVMIVRNLFTIWPKFCQKCSKETPVMWLKGERKDRDGNVLPGSKVFLCEQCVLDINNAILTAFTKGEGTHEIAGRDAF